MCTADATHLPLEGHFYTNRPVGELIISDKAMLKAAKCPDTSPEKLLTMSEGGVTLDRLLAKHPAAPESLLICLAQSGDKQTLRVISERDDMSVAVMQALFEHTDDVRVLTRLVIHPCVPHNVFSNLAAMFPTLFYRNKGVTWEWFSNSGIMESFGEASRIKLLKRIDCSPLVLKWGIEKGSRDEKLIAAKHNELSDELRLQLLADGDAEVDKNASVIRLGSDRVLRGQFPNKMRVSRLSYNVFKMTFRRSDLETQLRNKLGRLSYSQIQQDIIPAQPDMTLRGSTNIEALILDSLDAYIVVEDLPNLKEIVIEGKAVPWLGVQWLVLRNLPALKSIQIGKTGLKWLEINRAPFLEELNLSKASLLAHLSIAGVESLEDLVLSGCRKLPSVEGISSEKRVRLRVDEQLTENLRLPKEINGTNVLSYAEIDATLDVINKNAIGPSGEDDLALDATESLRFSFQLLKPKESTYTANTGEVFPYEARVEVLSPRGARPLDSMGMHAPEDCISWAKEWARSFGIKGIDF